MALKALAGKVAIVTASTDGIGLAIARRLGVEGANIVISSRRKENVEKTVKSLQQEDISVVGTVCHVGKEIDRFQLVEEAVKRFGGVDIFVSNAAVNPAMADIVDTTEEVWDRIFDTNVKAAFLLTKLVVPEMEKRGKGSIIYVSSVGAYASIKMVTTVLHIINNTLTVRGLGVYSISKTALLGLTKALAGELASKNIRVNGIAPGIIKTRFSEPLWKQEGPLQNAAKRNIAMRRFGEVDECSGAAVFLASDSSSYMTGETLLVTGGMPVRM